MDSCIFCKIVKKEIPGKIFYEDENFLAFENINKSAPVHLLVVPKIHVDKKDYMSGKENNFWNELMKTVLKILKQEGLDVSGYRLMYNGAGYNGIDHEHIHILGGKGWRPNDNL